jgi:hypothetical protein
MKPDNQTLQFGPFDVTQTAQSVTISHSGRILLKAEYDLEVIADLVCSERMVDGDDEDENLLARLNSLLTTIRDDHDEEVTGLPSAEIVRSLFGHDLLVEARSKIPESLKSSVSGAAEDFERKQEVIRERIAMLVPLKLVWSLIQSVRYSSGAMVSLGPPSSQEIEEIERRPLNSIKKALGVTSGGSGSAFDLRHLRHYYASVYPIIDRAKEIYQKNKTEANCRDWVKQTLTAGFLEIKLDAEMPDDLLEMLVEGETAWTGDSDAVEKGLTNEPGTIAIQFAARLADPNYSRYELSVRRLQQLLAAQPE